MYKWQQVKSLRVKGESIKKISRTLRLSKNTVRKYLRQEGPPALKKREYERMLAGYEEKIREMLQKRYIGTRIYTELTDRGYKGSLSTLHRYIRQMKGEQRRQQLTTTRVETAPGVQMQYDWKEWALPVEGKLLKIYIHELLLSYSRKKYYTYSLTITTSDVLRAIKEGIDFFEGVAAELVIDNAKQMIITHERDGIVRYNDEFLLFCGLYGIEPNPCRTYRARTKGKVEKPFFYLQEHLLRGLEVKTLGEFDKKLEGFTLKYNSRQHSSLKEAPEDRYVRERGHLRRMPKVEPTRLFPRAVRTVSNDGYIAYKGGFYPVAMRLSLRDVFIEPILGRRLVVYDKAGHVVADYEVTLWQTGKKPLHPEHEQINDSYRQKKEARRSEIVKRFTATFADAALPYIEGLKGAVGLNVYWHLKEIMKYTDLCPVEEVAEVIKECITIKSYHKNSVKRLLSLREIPRPVAGVETPVAMMRSLDIRRDLSVYKVQGGAL